MVYFVEEKMEPYEDMKLTLQSENNFNQKDKELQFVDLKIFGSQNWIENRCGFFHKKPGSQGV